MASSEKEPSPFSKLLSAVVMYFYERSRPQFHPALYVLLYAAMYIAMLQCLLTLVSITPWFNLVIDYELVGLFVGCIAFAELVRGHVKRWHGCSESDWCYFAMPFGGAAMNLAFWGIIVVTWGRSVWYEPILYMVGGAAIYTLLGWLFHLGAKQEAKKAS